LIEYHEKTFDDRLSGGGTLGTNGFAAGAPEKRLFVRAKTEREGI